MAPFLANLKAFAGPEESRKTQSQSGYSDFCFVRRADVIWQSSELGESV